MSVSCPDWSRLAAARNASLNASLEDGAEPADWALALEHFDRCALCRKEALKADPLLVFRRLPVADLSATAEQQEIESMQQAVAAMRTARRLERHGEDRSRFAGWRRWAAAAVLTVASLGVGRELDLGRGGHGAVPPEAAPVVPARAVTVSSAGAPLLDGLDRPGARVYQWDSDDLSTVMIVDENLENLGV